MVTSLGLPVLLDLSIHLQLASLKSFYHCLDDQPVSTCTYKISRTVTWIAMAMPIMFRSADPAGESMIPQQLALPPENIALQDKAGAVVTLLKSWGCCWCLRCVSCLS